MTLTADQDLELMARIRRQYEIEQFYYHEAHLLDTHSYDPWVDLFTDDARYFMPIRRTRTRRELDKEFTKPGEMAYFDDDKAVLRGRAAKFNSGTAWAEDPPSRTRHLITNVRILADDGDELTVESAFMLYRTRLKSEEDMWVGRRVDTLRLVDGQIRIAYRTIYLDQTIILSANLSNFM